jgi:hypothetical protein
MNSNTSELGPYIVVMLTLHALLVAALIVLARVQAG